MYCFCFLIVIFYLQVAELLLWVEFHCQEMLRGTHCWVFCICGLCSVTSFRYFVHCADIQDAFKENTIIDVGDACVVAHTSTSSQYCVGCVSCVRLKCEGMLLRRREIQYILFQGTNFSAPSSTQL